MGKKKRAKRTFNMWEHRTVGDRMNWIEYPKEIIVCMDEDEKKPKIGDTVKCRFGENFTITRIEEYRSRYNKYGGRCSFAKVRKISRK